MTMHRDRHGRWIPTEGEGTMTFEKAREERRNFYVGEIMDHGTFPITSAEASPNFENFISDDGSPTSFCRRTNAFLESNRNRMATSTALERD